MRGERRVQLTTGHIHLLQTPFDELLNASWKTRQSSRPSILEAVYPASTVSVSVTGTACSLNCSHCGGKYLSRMKTLESLDGIISDKAVTGILLSGGCSFDGRVPVAETIEEICGRIEASGRNIRINAHPGLVDDTEARVISSFADTISFDFVLDDLTIKEAFGSNRTGRDYVRAFDRLRKGKAKVVPHILVGLYKGMVKGEYEAIEFLLAEGIDELIFIVFIPTPDTAWSSLSPPELDHVLRLMAWTRVKSPAIKITLGCMRPKGTYSQSLDVGSVLAGVDGIVLPHRRAILAAQDRNLLILRKEGCCAFD